VGLRIGVNVRDNLRRQWRIATNAGQFALCEQRDCLGGRKIVVVLAYTLACDLQPADHVDD